MLNATNNVKNSDKGKYVWNDCKIAFDAVILWSFRIDFSRNAIFLGVINSSSSHDDNCKNIFLALGKRLTDDINSSFIRVEKNFTINFGQTKAKVYLNWNYNNSFSNRKEIT